MTVVIISFQRGLTESGDGVEVRILSNDILDDNAASVSYYLDAGAIKKWKWRFLMSLNGKDESLLSLQTGKDLMVVKDDGSIFSVVAATANPSKYYNNSFRTFIIKSEKKGSIKFGEPCIVSASKRFITVKHTCFISKYSWRVYKEEEETVNICTPLENEDAVKDYIESATKTSANVPNAARISYSLAEQSKLITLSEVSIAEATSDVVVNRLSTLLDELTKKTVFAKEESHLLAGNVLILTKKICKISEFFSIEIMRIDTKRKTYHVKVYDNGEQGRETEEIWALSKLKQYSWMVDVAKFSQSPSSLIKGNHVELLSKTGNPTKDSLPASFHAWITDIDMGMYTFSFENASACTGGTTEVESTPIVISVK